VKPVRVSVVVQRPPQEVFDFLDVPANHAPFLDHMWTDFEFSGPVRGVGSRLRARSLAPGPEDWTEVEVIEVDVPRRILERGSGAQGRRRTQGTYLLEQRRDGNTDVTFELRFLEVPRAERLTAPLLRLYVRRLLNKAMQRLAGQLAATSA
jgi:carbon monoxide dehydrogenase subunit G